MIDRPSARSAYVKAEVATALAHQIRALRIQRGWTQRELARRLRTSTSVVSRFEDPSYGKLSLQTLLELAEAFDIGLSVRFISLVEMVKLTFVPKASDRYVEPFESESMNIGFVADAPSNGALVQLQEQVGASEPATGVFNVKPGLLHSAALPNVFSNSICVAL